MFDNPKKELERLQEQLLAAEARPEEDFEDLPEELYEEFEEDEVYDEELESILSGKAPRLRHDQDANRDVSRRAAGFDAEDYEMDANRYVPAPAKKNIGCLAAFGIVQAIAVIALVAWMLLRRML